MIAPVIVIYVRHSADCKYAGDKFCRRCRCWKHYISLDCEWSTLPERGYTLVGRGRGKEARAYRPTSQGPGRDLQECIGGVTRGLCRDMGEAVRILADTINGPGADSLISPVLLRGAMLARIPALPKIRVDEPPKMPLTEEEFILSI